MTKHIALLVAVLSSSSIASAESLKEKEQRKREDEILQKSAKEMNDVCGSNIKAVGDWDTFKGALTDTQAHHVGLNCAFMVLDTIKNICQGGDEAKQAVRAGITTMRCQGGGDQDISLKGKVVIFKTRIDSTKSGVPTTVQEYLKKNL